MDVVSITNLSLKFAGLEALREIDLSVKSGEVIALIGPSGCGKSTLLRIIAGIIPHMIPATLDGGVEVFGKPPRDLVPGTIDMVFQSSDLLPWRSTKENVTLGLELLRNGSKRLDPIEILADVGLEEFTHLKPIQLSGGMRQRAGLAKTLVTTPKLLLMDEPFASLDALTKERMWTLVEQLRDKGLISTAILVTHQIEEAVILSDRVVIMTGKNPGRITHEVEVSLPRPRISTDKITNPAFFEVANEVRSMINRGER